MLQLLGFDTGAITFADIVFLTVATTSLVGVLLKALIGVLIFVAFAVSFDLTALTGIFAVTAFADFVAVLGTAFATGLVADLAATLVIGFAGTLADCAANFTVGLVGLTTTFEVFAGAVALVATLVGVFFKVVPDLTIALTLLVLAASLLLVEFTCFFAGFFML